MLLSIILFSMVFCVVDSSRTYDDTVAVMAQDLTSDDSGATLARLFCYCPQCIGTHNIHVYYKINDKWKSSSSTMTSTNYFTTFLLQNGEKLKSYTITISDGSHTVSRVDSLTNKDNWMYAMKDDLTSFTLKELVIPGTHRSGAYGNEGTNLKYHQDRTIKDQLMDGIRYLDLEVARFGMGWKREYAVMHDGHRLTPMVDVVRQINEFMNLTHDVVIVSFTGFPQGFSNKKRHHRRFIHYLERNFQQYAHHRSHATLRLGDFWKSSKRLVLTYDHPIYERYSILWKAIPQVKSNLGSISELDDFAGRVFPRDCGPPPSPGRKCDPQLQAVIFHMLPDNETLSVPFRNHWYQAEVVARPMFMGISRGWNNVVNIIAVDYYEVTGLVELAVQLNKQRAAIKSSRI